MKSVYPCVYSNVSFRPLHGRENVPYGALTLQNALSLVLVIAQSAQDNCLYLLYAQYVPTFFSSVSEDQKEIQTESNRTAEDQNFQIKQSVVKSTRNIDIFEDDCHSCALQLASTHIWYKELQRTGRKNCQLLLNIWYRYLSVVEKQTICPEDICC